MRLKGTTSYEHTTLNPLKTQPKTRKLAVFDIEGDGREDGFICGSVITDGELYDFIDKEQMARFLLSKKLRNHYIFAVNLQYDMPILYQPFDEYWKFYFSNSRLIRAVHEDKSKNKHLFLDTLNVAPGFSVAKMGKVVGIPKLEMPDELKQFTISNRLASTIPPKLLHQILIYNHRDVEVTYRFIDMWQSGLLALGTHLKPTVASTAMDLFRRQHLKRPASMPKKYVNEWVRSAYYGGRVEVFKKGLSENLYYYDFNSLYPSVMLNNEYPDISSQRSINKNKTVKEILEDKGIIECEIDIPDMYIPLIPMRHENRLIFPVGHVKGVYTTDEIKMIIEYGGHLKRIIKGWTYRRTLSPFSSYVKEMYEKRMEYKKKGDERQYVVKILMNSLYGKFGQRLDGNGGLMRMLTRGENWKQLKGCNTIDWNDNVWIQYKRNKRHAPKFLNTIWSSYVTAYGRIKLWELMNKIGEDIVYCDTDSIVTHKKQPTSNKLGDIKLEETIIEGIFLYPKVYYIKTNDDEEYYKIRGVPRSYRKEFFKKGSAVYSQPTKMKGAIRRHKRIAIWEKTKKEHKATYDKRNIINSHTNFYNDVSDSFPYRF